MKKKEEIKAGRGRGAVPSAFAASALRASKVGGKLVWQLDGLMAEIQLRQHAVDEFSVIYGKEVKYGNYGQSCHYLGQAIMHALACGDALDNREPSEGKRTRSDIRPIHSVCFEGETLPKLTTSPVENAHA